MAHVVDIDVFRSYADYAREWPEEAAKEAARVSLFITVNDSRPGNAPLP